MDDAGRATPDAVDAITERGGEVVLAREVRASFDDVFATLVGRRQAEVAAAAAPDGEAPDTDRTAAIAKRAGPDEEAAA